MKTLLACAALLFTAVSVYSMAGKVEKIPMKINTAVNIPDGEFLHYGYYDGGEKKSDLYMVTINETNGKGELMYRVYSISVKFPSDKKIPKKYTDWPSFSVIDPRQGLTIESLFSDTNVIESDPGSPYSGLIYSHYQLLGDMGYVEYRSKIIKDNKLKESKTRVNLIRNFPTWDGTSFFYFPARLMDIRGGGIMYIVSPEFMKDPMPFSFNYKAKETIRVKAGEFNTYKVITVSGDPFLGKLAEPVLKKAAFWIDESTGITVKIQYAFGYGVEEVEEISNVNIKRKGGF